ncbi:phage tail tape measure protein [Paraburkholderia sp. BR10936]|uniref:phage tail tape measure protein n=1 Tax=Paraburkholderia sp. BR10936 TaxID=3236993 RepID=UPI0034D32CE4
MANGSDLKLRVLFDMIDGATKPLKNIMAGNKGLAKSLKESRDELTRLRKAHKDVTGFREMAAGLNRTKRELTDANAHVKALAAGLRASGPPSRQMIADFEKAKSATAKLATAHRAQTLSLNELRTQLGGAGINTRNLAQHERELRASIAATSGTIDGQVSKLEQLTQREKAMASARAKMGKLQGTAANMAVAGYAAKAAGSHIIGDLSETLDQSKAFESEAVRIKALGLGDHATADAVKYAKAMKQMGTSTTDNLTLMRDSLTIFADEHHAQMVMPTLAKMKFTNEALFGAEDGHANEEKFMNMLKVIELRGGTKDEATFKDEANMVQKVITATGGRVGGDQWMQFIQTGGVAAKQMRKDAFFYQMEPLIQEMGGHAVGTGLMSAYNNVYQGKTTVKAARELVGLGLISKDGVEYNKMGQVNHFKTGALKGSDILKNSPLEWMEKVLLPSLAAKGITDPNKVKDTIATIFTNRTAANLFTTMYMQRDQIHKNERLNAGADGIDEGAEKASQMTQGRELEALAKIRDLKLEIGQKVSPIYNAGLSLTAGLLDSVTGFMKEHSTAAQVVLVTLAALAAMLVGGGMFTIALAGVLGPLALVKFSMTALGMQGGILSRVLAMQAGAWRFLGRSAMLAGRAMLMNPIGLAITAIAVGAYLIYRYWEPIKAFFAGLWGDIQQAFAGGLSGIGALIVNWSPLGLFYQAFAGVLRWFGVDMPAKFSEFGSNLISGLVNGITNGLGTVKEAITNVASNTVTWFKEKLGIHSPSRVFGELGGFISQGAAIGMEAEQGRIAKAAIGLATLAATSFGGTGAAQAAGGPGVAIDTRPALQARQAAGIADGVASAGGGDQYIFHITGSDPKEIANQVRQAIEQIERKKASRASSRLSD